MRMGCAPLLALLEPALAQELGFERLCVIGTPCSDNTTTERSHEFLELVGQQVGTEADAINCLEFRADYHVELCFKDGRTEGIPFLQQPSFSSPAAPVCCPTSPWAAWAGRANRAAGAQRAR